MGRRYITLPPPLCGIDRLIYDSETVLAQINIFTSFIFSNNNMGYLHSSHQVIIKISLVLLIPISIKITSFYRRYCFLLKSVPFYTNPLSKHHLHPSTPAIKIGLVLPNKHLLKFFPSYQPQSKHCVCPSIIYSHAQRTQQNPPIRLFHHFHHHCHQIVHCLKYGQVWQIACSLRPVPIQVLRWFVQ